MYFYASMQNYYLMQFRTEHHIQASDHKISHQEKILLIGSCFSDNIGQRLQIAGFDGINNPFGTVYNAQSILDQLSYAWAHDKLDLAKIGYNEAEQYFFHYDFHSTFKEAKRDQLVENIAAVKEKLLTWGQPEICIVSIGTSWVYTHASMGEVVANCHKMPATLFNKKLVNKVECLDILRKIKELMPSTRIIWTVSPVRHLKDGMVENNRSKAILIDAVHTICEEGHGTYFPSYELVMDDLRDYRYYDRDLLHPNDLAIDYIWEKFAQAYFSDQTNLIVNKTTQLRQMETHRPFLADGAAYKNHLQKIEKTKLELEVLRQKSSK